MSMELELEGEWWLANAPTERVAGVLKYSVADGARLSLIGALRRNQNVEVRVLGVGTPTTYERIHGATDRGEVTLDDCRQTFRQFRMGDAPDTQRFYASAVIVGGFFLQDEVVDARTLTVGIDNLADWTGRSGISEQVKLGPNGPVVGTDSSIMIEGTYLGDEAFRLADRTRIVLRHKVGIGGDGLSQRAITQGYSIRIEPPRRTPVLDLIDVASDLQDLVAIAINRPAAFNQVTFTHPDLFDGEKRHRRFHDVEYYRQWSVLSEEKKNLSPSDLFFDLADFGGVRGVRAWMHAAQAHRSALGRVMSTIYSQDMFVSDRLLNRTAALEAFDRDTTAYANSKFKARMERCANLAGPPFADLVGDIPTWSEAMRVQRDDVAHHFGRAIASSELYFLAESAYWLFVLCMMRSASVREAVLDRIVEHRRWGFVRSGVRSVLRLT